MIKESTLWYWIRDLPKRYNYKLFLSRIESRGTKAGIPDVFFCYEGMSGFIELKSWSKLSVHQHIWAKNYILSGGHMFVLYIDKHTNIKILKKYKLSDLEYTTENKSKVYPVYKVDELIPLIEMLIRADIY